MTRLPIGLQLYTLREEAKTDFAGMLRKTAELGYEGVEFAGYGGLGAETLRRQLDELGIRPIGSHVSLERMLTAANEEIEYNLTLGSRYVIVPWMAAARYASEAALAETCAALESIGRLCADRGLVFAYHNHSFELERESGDKRLLDAIFDAVPADALQVELDACWVHGAGFDPTDYIRKYSGRIPLVHLKDMSKAAGEAETVELGRGEVDLPAIAAAAAAAGTEWLIVEQDRCRGSAWDSVAESMAWLKSNGLR